MQRIRPKFLFYKYYWIIAIILLIIAISVSTVKSVSIDWKLFASFITVTLSFVYFIQKQKLEELKLFKELFQKFNKCFDDMNDDLNRINEQGADLEINGQDRQKLYDYFNLCGEEYLYYKKGYIFPEVWEAWLNGMRYFYKNKKIKDIWDKELESNSYYGFNQSMF